MFCNVNTALLSFFSILPDSNVKFACVHLYTSSRDRKILRRQWACCGCSMREHGVIIDWGNQSDIRICPLANLIFILLLKHYWFRLLTH